MDIVARIDLTEWETNPESTHYQPSLKAAWAAKWRFLYGLPQRQRRAGMPKRRTKVSIQAVDDFTAERALQ